MTGVDVFAINLKDHNGDVVETVHSVNDVPILTRPMHHMGLWAYGEWHEGGKVFDREQIIEEFPLCDIDEAEDINPRRFNRDYADVLEHLTIIESGKQVFAHGYEVIKNGEVVELELEEDYITEKVVHEYTRN